MKLMNPTYIVLILVGEEGVDSLFYNSLVLL